MPSFHGVLKALSSTHMWHPPTFPSLTSAKIAKGCSVEDRGCCPVNGMNSFRSKFYWFEVVTWRMMIAVRVNEAEI